MYIGIAHGGCSDGFGSETDYLGKRVEYAL
jgi:hypothetical protein